MSLLNSSVFSAIAGKVDSLASNIMDHASSSSILGIVKNGIAQVRAGLPSRDELLAALTCSSDLYCDSIVEKGEVSLSTAAAKIGTSFTKSVPSALLTSLNSLYVEVQQSAGTVFKVVSIARGITISIAFRSYSENKLSMVLVKTGLPEISIGGVAVDTGVYTGSDVQSVSHDYCTGTEFEGYLSFSPILALIKIIAVSRVTSYCSSISNTIFSATSDAFGRMSGVDSAADQFADSIKRFVSSQGIINSDGNYEVSFTDEAGHAFHLVMYAGEGSSFSCFWNDDPDYPFAVYDATGALSVNNVIVDVDYKLYDLASFTSQLVESRQINGFLSELSEFCFNLNATTSDVSSTMMAYAQGCSTTVKDMISTATSAFNRGGNLGLAYYIVGFFTTTRSARDEDNVIKFTDACSWTPSNYVAGIIGSIGSILSTIGLAIAACFSKILGAVVSVIGLLAKAVSSLVKRSWDQTKFQFSEDPFSIEWSAPYSGIQQSISIGEEISETSLAQYIVENKSIAYWSVPGGYLICGPSQYNEEGVVSSLGIEFHPDVVDRRHYFARFASFFWSLDPTSTGWWPYSFTRDDLLRAQSMWRLEDIINNSSADLLVNLSFQSSKENFTKLSKIFRWWFEWSHEWIAMWPGEIPVTSDNSHYPDNGIIPAIVNANTWLYALLGQSYAVDSDADSPDFSPAVFREFFSIEAYRLISTDPATFKTHSSSIMDNHGLGMLLTYTFAGTQLTSDQVPDPSWAQSGHWIMYLLERLGASVEIQFDLTGDMRTLPSSDSYLTASGWAAWWNLCLQPYLLNTISAAIGSVVAIDRGCFTGYPKDIPSKYTWFVKAPEYTESSLWTAYIVGAIVAVAATAVTAVIAIKARKAIKTWNAKRSAEVEAAWTRLTANPTAENATAYYKKARRNNFISTFFGGAKYSTSNYWAGDTSESSGGLQPLSSITSKVSSASDARSAANAATSVGVVSLDTLMQVIVGSNHVSD